MVTDGDFLANPKVGIAECCSISQCDLHIQKETVMLKVTVQNLGNVKVFRCTGRIVYGSEGTLKTVLSRQLGLRVAVFDLAGVTDIDAAGLGSLIDLRTRAKASGVQFRLMNLHPRIEDLFMLTNLRSVFEVCSVPEMVQLLCHAWNQPQISRKIAAGSVLEVLDDTALATVRIRSDSDRRRLQLQSI
jgi:anti-anti-sigma factor